MSTADVTPAAPLTGARVRLVPLFQRHYDWLYDLALSEWGGARWRFRGSTPSPARFAEVLWQQVLAQFVVCAHSGEPLGIVQAYGPDHRNRHAYLSVLFTKESSHAGWPMEGIALFVNYLFCHWEFHKLYIESIAPNVKTFGSLVGRALVEEAHFVDHERYQGGWVGLHVYALYRSWWTESDVVSGILRHAAEN